MIDISYGKIIICLLLLYIFPDLIIQTLCRIARKIIAIIIINNIYIIILYYRYNEY